MDDNRTELITLAAQKRTFMFQTYPPDRGDYVLHPDSWVTPGDTERDIVKFRAFMVANPQYRYELEVGLNNGAWIDITVEDLDIMLTTYYPNTLTYYSQTGGTPVSVRGRTNYKTLSFQTLSAYFPSVPQIGDFFVSGNNTAYRITAISSSAGSYTIALSTDVAFLTGDDVLVYLYSDSNVPLYA